MEEQTVSNAPTYDLFGLGNYIFESITAYGIVTSMVVAHVLWAIFHRKTFVQFYKWVFAGMRQQISASATRVYYEERIKALETDLDAERKRCDEHIREMREDYEHKIAKLEEKIDAMIKVSTEQSAVIAQLQERVTNLTERMGKKLTSVGKPRS